MKHNKENVFKRSIAIVLAVLMVLTAFPVGAVEATPSVLRTDIGEKTFAVGKATEFTFSTVANDYLGTMVVGSSNFNDPTAIKKLEYYEVQDGTWREFNGDFGPSTGFPMSDATSKFRVTFKKAGNYTFTAFVKKVEDGETLCSVEKSIEVTKTSAKISTDIADKTFVVNEATEFTFTTTANDDAGVMVIGKSDFNDPDAIEKLEYFEVRNETWYDLNGDFGGQNGFPVSDAKSKFRVTFKKAGEYSFNASLTGVSDGIEICSVHTEFKVFPKYDIEISSNDGGTVYLGEEKSTKSVSIKENDTIKANIKADEGYQISSVCINRVPVELTSKETLSFDVSATEDKNIEVAFVKVYTVSVSYSGGNGSVSTDPASEGGSVVVEKDSNVTITATPEADYRVSKVIINSVPEEFSDNTYSSSNPYVSILNADKDYEVEFVFAPLIYTVSVNEPQNGSAVLSASTVEINGEATLTITPDDGYMLDTISVNGSDVYEKVVDISDSEQQLSFSNITEDKDIAVTFAQTPAAQESDFSWNSDKAIRNDESLYVFKANTDVVFSTEKDGIKLSFSDGTSKGSYDEKRVVIPAPENTSKTITGISVFYKHAWHKFEISNAIEIVFDKVSPVVSISDIGEKIGGYYNDDFSIKISAEDGGKYSGLDTVEYWVVCGDSKETPNKIKVFTYDDKNAVQNTFEDTIKITAADYDNESVSIYVQTKDRAGNVSNIEKTDVKICTEAPSVSVSFSDEQPVEAIDNWYNSSRTATIKIVDRNDVFDEDAATAGIKFAEDSATSVKVSWDNKENTHTAEVEFNSEGHYEWSYSYTNIAGLTDEQITSTGENVYEFDIDKTKPEGTLVSDAFSGFEWSELLEKITFGLYSNNKFAVKLKDGKGTDLLSGYQKVSYYKSNSDSVLLESELIELYSNGEFSSDSIVVESDEQVAVYACIVDNAGNCKFIGTNGVIYDETQSEIKFDVIDKTSHGTIYGQNDVVGYRKDETDYKGIKIKVDVKDANADTDYYSGINKIEYKVEADLNGRTTVTQPLTTVYQFENDEPAKIELKREWSDNIIINAEENNGKNVTLTVCVTDNAGNVTTESLAIGEICLENIKASVSFSAEKAVTLEEGYGWYNKSRTAFVTVNDRGSCFDKDEFIKAIKVKVTDIDGKTVTVSGDDVKIALANELDNSYMFTVAFNRDGCYDWSIDYTNKAGNKLEEDNISYGTSESPKKFTVDANDIPSGTIKVDEYSWTDALLSALTFGLYSKETLKSSVSASDKYSDVKTEYYKYSGNSALKEDELKALDYTVLNSLYEDGLFSADLPDASTNEQFVIYARLTDKSGNFRYISSDGFEIDGVASELEVEAFESANTNGIYGIDNFGEYSNEKGESIKGIKIAVNAKDGESVSDAYAGIKNISYEVKAKLEGSVKTTQSGTLYNFDYKRNEGKNSNGGTLVITDANKEKIELSDCVPTKDMLCREWAGSIVIDAALNNSSEVSVYVVVTDNAGNVSDKELKFDFDSTPTKIALEFDNNECANSKYFDENRHATVTFTERADHFDKTDALKGILITAVDGKQGEISEFRNISWTEENTSTDNPDDNTFVASISFEKDANYTLTISYTDKAGNVNDEISDDSCIAPYEFTIDKANPTGSVSIGENNWSKLKDLLTFGLYSKENVSVSAIAGDDTSPVFIEYFKSNSDTALTAGEISSAKFEELVDSTVDTPHELCEIESDELFNVYVRVTDYAGHSVLFNTDGYIVDKSIGSVTIKATTKLPDGKTIYGIQDVEHVDEKNIDVIYFEAVVNENDKVCSGIKEITYEVIANSEEGAVTTQSGTLYKFDYTRDAGDENNGGKLTVTDSTKDQQDGSEEGKIPTKDMLKTSWTGKFYINASDPRNSSSNITVKVKATDNAGNVFENAINNINVNVVTPIINVQYDNNTPANEKYFGSDRKATVEFIERSDSFDEKAALAGIKASITAVDASGKDVENAYIIDEEKGENGWIHTADGSNNADKASHKIDVVFCGNANYTFSDISYAGKSGNKAEKTNFAEGNVAEKEFTVDKTVPVGKIDVNKENVWNKVISLITFGLFGNKEAAISIDASDDVSPITLKYYKTNNPIFVEDRSRTYSYSDDNTTAPLSSVRHQDLTVGESEQFVVYTVITDYAGNTTYVNTDGYIVDISPAQIDIEPEKANDNGIYNKDVNVNISVDDVYGNKKATSPYSGIQKIEYWVVCGEGEKAVETQRKVLYSFEYDRDEDENSNGGKLTVTDWASGKKVVTEDDGNIPLKDQLKSSWEGSVTVDSELNNNCDVTIFVKVTDNAGNSSEESQKLDIDIVAPEISVKYESTANEGAEANYFTSRTATVVITERNHHFNANNATKGISVEATDVKGNAINGAYTISEWSHSVDEVNPDMTTHTATVSFNADANYVFDIEYTDKAGLSAKDYKADKFCVDTNAPTGELTAKSKEGREETWTSTVDPLTYGFWSNSEISVSGSADDVTSPIKSVKYYMYASENAEDNTTALKKAELDTIDSSLWKNFKGVTVKENKQFVIYLKITDNAGNYSYVGTNGLIVDDKHPIEESVAPEITVTPEAPINGIYSKSVKVKIDVVDPTVGGAYSGLKEIRYEVYDRDSQTPDQPTQGGTLYTFTVKEPKQSELVKSWNGEITVDSKKNNSNNVQIVVYAVDNSLNAVDNSQKNSSSYSSIKIDTTAPKVDVSYNNNNVDSEKFFKADRVATIKVTERNFSSGDVLLTVKRDGEEIIPKLKWTKESGTYNGDDTVYSADIRYADDGVYTFNVEFTDMAGNKCKHVNFAKSSAPKKFVIDKTMPKVSVSSDISGKEYYNTSRTMTITVEEHNFIANRIFIDLSATDRGKSVSAPKISGWVNTAPDTYKTTILYSDNARYDFDIRVGDLAGNLWDNYSGEVFYVDKTAPEISIVNPLTNKDINNTANNDVIMPLVTYSDTNLDPDNITITLTRSKGGKTDINGKKSISATEGRFAFADFLRKKAIDDIYTLFVKVIDKAGNETTKTSVFSVNRFGSTYLIGSAFRRFINAFNKVTPDCVVKEINANVLSNIKVTLFKNNETIVLKENEDYKIEVNKGKDNDQWYSYEYTIFEDNFKDDGLYKINIHSEDAAGNIAENTFDTKKEDINFGIDNTNPTLNLTNLNSGDSYKVENYAVTIVAADNFKLSNLKVYLDGEETPSKEWNEEEVNRIINNQDNFVFNISGDSSSKHKVEVVAVDAAGNEYKEVVSDIVVSPSSMVIFYNNKPLFFGTIGGIIAVVAFVVFLVVFKRKKKEKEIAEED